MTNDCMHKDVLEDYVERRFVEEANQVGLCDYFREDRCAPMAQRAGEVGKTPVEESAFRQECRLAGQRKKR